MLIWMVIVILMLLTDFIYTTLIFHTQGVASGDVVVRWGAPGVWELVVVTFFPLMKILVTILWAAFFLMWAYRSHANNWSFKLPRLNYSPTMVVVWIIIPIANWLMGFLVLGEVFKASDPESDVPGSSLSWEYSGAPSMIGPWWTGMMLVAPLAMVPFLTNWIFGGLGPIGVRLIELAFFAITCTLMFIIWREAKELRDLQEKKYRLIYPNDQQNYVPVS